MGGICSRRSTEDVSTGGSFPHVNGHLNYGSGMVYQSRGVAADNNSNSMPSPAGETADKRLGEPYSLAEANMIANGMRPDDDISDGIPRLSRAMSNKSRSTKSRQAAVAKVSEVSSLLGRAGSAGFGKAVEVLDTLGSSMTNLNASSGFVSGVTTRGNKISILAFEVANTVVKGANLMQSLSKESIKHLKEVVLPSEGVQRLISKDMEELLRIAATDKRDELKVFSGEVVRFGNRCKDPQWHNLDRYFEKLGSELIPQKQLKEEAETVMQQLMTLVQYTAELYHELHALDRFEQDYRRKLQEEDNSNAAQKGRRPRNLKGRVEESKEACQKFEKEITLVKDFGRAVMEKLVDIVHFLHLEIHEAFGNADGGRPVKSNNQKLGSAGLALHYANIVTQLDTLVTRSSSVPPNTRDSLYQGLPPRIKSALRSKLQSFQLTEEKTAHHGFGWVGEWANNGSDVNKKPTGQTDLIRVETLHHADKDKTEAYILELVVWLHHLVSQSRVATNGGFRSPIKSPMRSPNQKTMIQLSTHKSGSSPLPSLTIEDQEMLRDVSKRKLTPGISKSQEFDTSKIRLSKHHRLSKSISHSPASETKKEPIVRRLSSVPVFDFDIDRIKALDVIDRVDTIRSV
ncbi:unnamed protein product [Camellia sinensis]